MRRFGLIFVPARRRASIWTRCSVDFDIRYHDEGTPYDVEISVVGVPTPLGFAQLNDELAADSRFRRGATMLVDCSELDTSALTDREVEALSEPMVERDWYYPPAAVAIVASDERTFAAMRAYRAHLGGSRSNRHLFRSRAEAVEWLNDLRGQM
jgi:hypothetical protein